MRLPRPIPAARAPFLDPFAQMNGTEKRRGVELDAMKRAGLIADWWFERVTFKLADDTRYTPDFVIQELDGTLRCEEIKGFYRDDAKVKARVFPMQFPFRLSVLSWQRRTIRWHVVEYQTHTTDTTDLPGLPLRPLRGCPARGAVGPTAGRAEPATAAR